jgi:hypothetical protein
MAIYRLLHRGQFVYEPELVGLMGCVYEDVLKALGLADRAAPVTEQIAKKIIELTKAGEHDPARLKDLTVQAFQK